jgi:hypothetical protein
MCHSATLSTINLTQAELGSNPGFCGERPPTKQFSHDMTCEAYKKLEVLFYVILPDFQKSIALCDGSQASLIRPSDNSNM